LPEETINKVNFKILSLIYLVRQMPAICHGWKRGYKIVLSDLPEFSDILLEYNISPYTKCVWHVSESCRTRNLRY